MPSTATSYTPTGIYSKSFLQSVWRNRAQLQDRERRGLIQFLYLTACSHVEHVIQELLCARLQFIAERIKWDASELYTLHGPIPTDDDGLSPITRSIVCISASLIHQARNSALTKLQELYSAVYPTSFKAAVGQDLTKDMSALGDLRNLFAHGRQLIIDFEAKPPYLLTDHAQLETDLTKNTISRAYERLKLTGISVPEPVTFANYHEWLDVIYSDAAVRYFFESCGQVEQKLLAANTFAGEQSVIHTHPLPTLD